MRSERLLAIIIIISQKGMVTGKELAEHFEVSLRTIYRDIEKISEAGVPVAAAGGKGGGFYIMEGYNLNNLFFNRREIAPIKAVMDNLSLLFGNNTQFNDIVMKFKSLSQGEERQEKLTVNMSHFSMEKELREYLYLLDKAIEQNRLIEFDYINRRMDYSRRIAEPMQIEFSDGHWYVAAYCRSRNDYRKFKLVRIRNMKLCGSFEKRDISPEKLKAVFNKSYEKNSLFITMEFSQRIGEQLDEYFSKDMITCSDDGRYKVEGYFSKDDGLMRFITGFGKECEVISPEFFRQEIKKYIKEMLVKYNG